MYKQYLWYHKKLFFFIKKKGHLTVEEKKYVFETNNKSQLIIYKTKSNGWIKWIIKLEVKLKLKLELFVLVFLMLNNKWAFFVWGFRCP